MSNSVQEQIDRVQEQITEICRRYTQPKTAEQRQQDRADIRRLRQERENLRKQRGYDKEVR